MKLRYFERNLVQPYLKSNFLIVSWIILDSPSCHLPFTTNDLYEFEGFEGTKEKCFRITFHRKIVIYLGFFLSVQFTVSQALRNQVLVHDGIRSRCL